MYVSGKNNTVSLHRKDEVFIIKDELLIKNLPHLDLPELCDFLEITVDDLMKRARIADKSKIEEILTIVAKSKGFNSRIKYTPLVTSAKGNHIFPLLGLSKLIYSEKYDTLYPHSVNISKEDGPAAASIISNHEAVYNITIDGDPLSDAIYCKGEWANVDNGNNSEEKKSAVALLGEGLQI